MRCRRRCLDRRRCRCRVWWPAARWCRAGLRGRVAPPLPHGPRCRRATCAGGGGGGGGTTGPAAPPLCGGVGVSIGERTAASAADVVAWASRLLTATVHAGAGQRLGAAADRGRPPWVGGPTAAAGGGTKEGPLRKASRPLSSPATGRGGPRRPAPPSDAQPWRRSPRGRGDGGGRPAAALSPARGVAARGARCPRPCALAVQRPAVLGGPEPTARCGR